MRLTSISIASLLLFLLIFTPTIGQDANTITIDNVQNLEEFVILEGHTQEVNAIAFSPIDSNILASAGDDWEVRIWNVTSNELLHILEGHNEDIQSIAISPDGRLVTSGDKDGNAIVWDIETGERLATLLHEDWVAQLDFVDSNILLASDGSGNLTFWNMTTFDSVGIIDNIFFAWALDYADNGLIATTGQRYEVNVWNGNNESLVQSLEGNTGEVRAVQFNDDASLLAGGGSFGNLIVWNTETWETVFTYDDVATVTDVLFSPIGDMIAISRGSFIEFLSVESGHSLIELNVASDSSFSIDFNLTGNMIAAATGDFVQIWRLPQDDVVHAQETTVGEETECTEEVIDEWTLEIDEFQDVYLEGLQSAINEQDNTAFDRIHSDLQIARNSIADLSYPECVEVARNHFLDAYDALIDAYASIEDNPFNVYVFIEQGWNSQSAFGRGVGYLQAIYESLP